MGFSVEVCGVQGWGAEFRAGTLLQMLGCGVLLEHARPLPVVAMLAARAGPDDKDKFVMVWPFAHLL